MAEGAGEREIRLVRVVADFQRDFFARELDITTVGACCFRLHLDSFDCERSNFPHPFRV